MCSCAGSGAGSSRHTNHRYQHLFWEQCRAGVALSAAVTQNSGRLRRSWEYPAATASSSRIVRQAGLDSIQLWTECVENPGKLARIILPVDNKSISSVILTNPFQFIQPLLSILAGRDKELLRWRCGDSGATPPAVRLSCIDIVQCSAAPVSAGRRTARRGARPGWGALRATSHSATRPTADRVTAAGQTHCRTNSISAGGQPSHIASSLAQRLVAGNQAVTTCSPQTCFESW